jgi:hypothetical protein
MCNARRVLVIEDTTAVRPLLALALRKEDLPEPAGMSAAGEGIVRRAIGGVGQWAALSRDE